MAEVYVAKALGPADLREAIGQWLTSSGCGLRIVAKDVQADGMRIDFVAAGSAGEAIAVVVGGLGETTPDGVMLSRGIAAAAWLEAHLADWLTLQPALPFDRNAVALTWVLCPDFRAPTLGAARALGPRVVLARYQGLASPSSEGVWIEKILDEAPAPPPSSGQEPERDTSDVPIDPEISLRSGLRLSDFGLSAEELAEFND